MGSVSPAIVGTLVFFFCFNVAHVFLHLLIVEAISISKSTSSSINDLNLISAITQTNRILTHRRLDNVYET